MFSPSSPVSRLIENVSTCHTFTSFDAHHTNSIDFILALEMFGYTSLYMYYICGATTNYCLSAYPI